MTMPLMLEMPLPVALLAEGVDRNSRMVQYAMVIRTVALLAEGVDRNNFRGIDRDVVARSPSSRRAWIEMLIYRDHTKNEPVALLAEGVDRN